MTLPLPAAVLWDLDGTLVDTEPSWMSAEYALAKRHGADWTRTDALTLVGNDLRTSAGYMIERMGLQMGVEEVVSGLVAEVVKVLDREVPVRPGVPELLAALHVAGVPCAVVTASYRPIADAVVRALGEHLFDAVITGDAVTHGKPHPEPYLTAARALGVDPRDCVAIEDSAPGTASADAAGCRVVLVPNLIDVAVRPGWTVLETLVGVTVTDLPGPQVEVR